MESTTARTIADALHVTTFTSRYDHPASNALENLGGRTHYADPGTLRYHKSRILSARPISGGAFFLLIESCALDYQNTRRGTRVVLFDMFGEAVYRPKLEECHRTRDQASKAFWAWFEGFDELGHYLQSMRRQSEKLAKQAVVLRQVAAALEQQPVEA